jgi:hypothetical protein
MNKIEFDIYPNMDADYIGSILCSAMDRVVEDKCNVIVIGNPEGASTEDIIGIIRYLLQMDKFHKCKMAIHFGNIDDRVGCTFR